MSEMILIVASFALAGCLVAFGFVMRGKCRRCESPEDSEPTVEINIGPVSEQKEKGK